jgi:hypothetical protein
MSKATLKIIRPYCSIGKCRPALNVFADEPNTPENFCCKYVFSRGRGTVLCSKYVKIRDSRRQIPACPVYGILTRSLSKIPHEDRTPLRYIDVLEQRTA